MLAEPCFCSALMVCCAVPPEESPHSREVGLDTEGELSEVFPLSTLFPTHTSHFLHPLPHQQEPCYQGKR